MTTARHLRLWAVLLTGSLLLLTAGPAHARKPTRAEKRLAKKLNQQALKLYKAEQFSEAADKFKAAYTLVKAPNVLYNLARARHRSGEPDKAKPHYEELVLKYPKFDERKRAKAYAYIKAIEAEAAKREQARQKQRQLEALQAAGDALTAAGKHAEAAQHYLRAHASQPSPEWIWRAAQSLEAAGDAEAARAQYRTLLALEGVTAARKAQAKARIGAIEASLARPEAKKPPKEPAKAVVEAPDVPPKQPPSPSGVMDAPEPEDDKSLLISGAVTLGLGVVGAVAGIALHLNARAERNDVRLVIDEARAQGVPVTTLTQADAVAAEQSANDLALGSAISLGLGSALMVTGIALLVVDATSAPEAGGASVNVGFAPGVGSGMLTLRGGF